MTTQAEKTILRPPIVTVMGHIDHGKSTLLDYIRKTKVTESEAGGITQHLSAYEVQHTDGAGNERTITFLDTPGHEAFQHLRSRGSLAADIAILVVAADDGVKPQTLEALKAIEGAGIPYLVAISKIDKNNADVERTKHSLLEHGVYLEGLGGAVPYIPISSKTGEGVSELLDLLLLMADMEELVGHPEQPASGVVIESRCDPKRGMSATLIVRDGTLHTGEYVVAGDAFAPLRIMENFLGKKIQEASCSTPVMVVGFSDTPPVGTTFTTVKDKKAAQKMVQEYATREKTSRTHADNTQDEEGERFFLPMVIKSDVVGSIDAIKHELKKHEDERTTIKVIHEGVGTITEGDVKYVSKSKNAIILGFNVGVDAAAKELAERVGVEIALFSVIYDLTDWIPGAILERRPKIETEKILGRVLILKTFSYTKKTQTIGCRVEDGVISIGDTVRLVHNDQEAGAGIVRSLKSGKADVDSVTSGNECGASVEMELEHEPSYGDVLVSYTTVEE